MQLRIALALTAVAAAALMAACAGQQQSIEDLARAACEDQNTPAAEMAECIEETEETLRRAREYSPPPPPRPPSRQR
jgi:hypothetical protein